MSDLQQLAEARQRAEDDVGITTDALIDAQYAYEASGKSDPVLLQKREDALTIATAAVGRMIDAGNAYNTALECTGATT